jgi:16S rRNA processing protein RimM
VDVIETGANDVWVVQGTRFGEVLLPVTDEVVLDVDDASGTAHVRLLPGLIDGEHS